MALSPKEDGGIAGFNPTVARRAPTIPGVTTIPGFSDNAPANRPESPKQLIVGRDIELTGQIAACESLIVEGRVEAELNDSRRLEITETGAFRGNVEIEEAVIGGFFEGELTVRNKLKVQSGGRIVGVIRYAAIEIEAGGQISGTVEILQGGSSQTANSEAHSETDLEAANDTALAEDGTSDGSSDGAELLEKSEIDDLLSDPK